MHLNEITEEVFNQMIQGLSQRYEAYTIRLTEAFQPELSSSLFTLIPREGFPLAHKIHTLLNALQGVKPFPANWEEIVLEVIELVWGQPFRLQNTSPKSLEEWKETISWPDWEVEPIGLIIRLTLDANDLMDGKDMKLPALARLSNLTYPAVVKIAKSIKNPLQAKKVNGEWIVPNEFAKEWLTNRGIRFK